MVSMFAGVNSPLGFVSRFSGIQNEQEGCRKVYIKGGPGMGKSTVLKKIAARAERDGYECEVFPCSSDKNSLDGVNIPELKTALIDATAPHNSDPLYPGVSGEIFNVASCLDFDKVKEHDEQIRLFDRQKKKYFEKGYNYLKAAKPLLLNEENEYKGFMDMRGINIESKRMINKLFSNLTATRRGEIRSLFLSAICPDGVTSFADEVFAGVSVISVKGGYGTDIFMKNIAEAALSGGLDITVFCCPMSPTDKYEHILIPEMNIAFTTYNYYHHCRGREIIDLDEYLKADIELCDKNHGELAEVMIEKAVECFAKAKAAHAFLESFYVPAMDFGRLDVMSKELEDSIFM